MNNNNEEKLLEIAKEVEMLNINNLDGLKLTGSLMLYIRGINKRREATDIDFICEGMCSDGPGKPIAPKGFKLNEMDGSRSCVDCVQFINDEGVKIEFMVSDEPGIEVIDGIKCSDIQQMVLAKLYFIKNDKTEESKFKHFEDLIYLFENNEII